MKHFFFNLSNNFFKSFLQRRGKKKKDWDGDEDFVVDVDEDLWT